MNLDPNIEWTVKDFIDYDALLFSSQSCSIVKNRTKPGYHLSLRTYASYDRPDYEVVKYLTDAEVLAAKEAGIRFK